METENKKWNLEEWRIAERQKAIAAYLENPNYCQFCGKLIPVPDNRMVSEIRTKKTCNHTCATNLRWKDKENTLTDHNRNFGNFAKKASMIGNAIQKQRALDNYIAKDPRCIRCNAQIPPPLDKDYAYSLAAAAKRKYCSRSCGMLYQWEQKERADRQPHLTETIGKLTKGEVKLFQIRDNAVKVFEKLSITACQKCGYSDHIDVAHKVAVCTFSADTPLSVINAPDNLMGLCKNCHWEYDQLNSEKKYKLGGYKKKKKPS